MVPASEMDLALRLKELEKRADNSLKTDGAPSKAEKPEEEANLDALVPPPRHAPFCFLRIVKRSPLFP